MDHFLSAMLMARDLGPRLAPWGRAQWGGWVCWCGTEVGYWVLTLGAGLDGLRLRLVVTELSTMADVRDIWSK